jgi:hypothetical protein
MQILAEDDGDEPFASYDQASEAARIEGFREGKSRANARLASIFYDNRLSSAQAVAAVKLACGSPDMDKEDVITFAMTHMPAGTPSTYPRIEERLAALGLGGATLALGGPISRSNEDGGPSSQWDEAIADANRLYGATPKNKPAH